MDPLAKRGFGRDLETALIYDRGRPGYAPDLAHWFDGDAALRELARVIKPGGALAVIFNFGLQSDPPTPELEELVNDHRSRAKVTKRPDWRPAFDRGDRFEPLRSREFLHSREQDRETFAAYLSSLAFIAAMPDRGAVAEEIRALTPERSLLTMRTECFWTRRRP